MTIDYWFNKYIEKIWLLNLKPYGQLQSKDKETFPSYYIRKEWKRNIRVYEGIKEFTKLTLTFSL